LKRTALWIAAAALAFAAILVWSTLGQRRYRVEVCMEFQGRRVCRTASGATEAEAVRAAAANACTLIASGMTDSMACERTPPAGVRWLKRP
jgi:hypothetical protein